MPSKQRLWAPRPVRGWGPGCAFQRPTPAGSAASAVDDMAVSADPARPAPAPDLTLFRRRPGADGRLPRYNPACSQDRLSDCRRRDPARRAGLRRLGQVGGYRQWPAADPAAPTLGSAWAAPSTTRACASSPSTPGLKFYIGDGSGVDGMALVFAKAAKVEDLLPRRRGQSLARLMVSAIWGWMASASSSIRTRTTATATPTATHVAFVTYFQRRPGLPLPRAPADSCKRHQRAWRRHVQLTGDHACSSRSTGEEGHRRGHPAAAGGLHASTTGWIYHQGGLGGFTDGNCVGAPRSRWAWACAYA